MAAGWSNLPDLEARLAAHSEPASTPDFEPLAASFKRIRNILEQAKFTGGGAVDPACSNPVLRPICTTSIAASQGQPIETVISQLRPKVDLFFDKVW